MQFLTTLYIVMYTTTCMALNEHDILKMVDAKCKTKNCCITHVVHPGISKKKNVVVVMDHFTLSISIVKDR